MSSPELKKVSMTHKMRRNYRILVVSVPPKIDESMSPKTERDRLDVCYKHNNTFTIQLQPGTDLKVKVPSGAHYRPEKGS